MARVLEKWNSALNPHRGETRPSILRSPNVVASCITQVRIEFSVSHCFRVAVPRTIDQRLGKDTLSSPQVQSDKACLVMAS